MTATAPMPARILNLVAPLPHEGTAMRTAATAAPGQAWAGAVGELIGAPLLRPAHVDSATVAPTPGTRTSTTATRTTTTRATKVVPAPSADPCLFERLVRAWLDCRRTKRTTASAQCAAAIWIALLTGCRRGEVLAIEPHMIGPNSITLPAGNTKTLRTRTVPIVPALRPWLAYVPLRMNFEGLKTSFRRARAAAGMEHVNFHDLRHSCATILLSLGTPLDVVRDILGHTTIKTTERYAHAIVDRQRDALERLGEAAALHQGRAPAHRRRARPAESDELTGT